jgi:hypothetical protein
MRGPPDKRRPLGGATLSGLRERVYLDQDNAFKIGHCVDLFKQPDGTFAISDRVSIGEIIAALLRKLGVRP